MSWRPSFSVHVTLLRNSSGIDVPGKEVQYSAGENVVAVAGHHVSRAANVGEFDLREASEEFVGALLADEVAHLAADQQDGHPVAQDRLNGRVHPVGIGDLEWGMRRSAADELRIPMPVP